MTPAGDRYREALGTGTRALVPDDGGEPLTPAAFRSPPKGATLGWVGAHAEVKAGSGGVSGVLVLAVDPTARGMVDPESIRLFRWQQDERRFTLVEASGCDDGAIAWGRIDASGKYAAIGLNADPAVLGTIHALAAMRDVPGVAEAERRALHERVCGLVLCAGEPTEAQAQLCAACRELPKPFDLPEFQLLPRTRRPAPPPVDAPPPPASEPLVAGAWPGEGGVSAMALEPGAPGRLYVAAEGGGMWRLDGLADDHAASWVALGGLGARVVRAVAVAGPAGIVYVADESGHLLRSPDRGATWGAAGSIGFRHVWRIVVDPAVPDRLYVASGSAAGVGSEAEGETGLWESADGGRTWTAALTGDTIDAAVDPDDGSILYAAVRDEGLCMTTPPGRGWALVMPFVSAAVHGGSMIRLALGRAVGGASRTVAVRFGQELFVNRHGGRSRGQPNGGPWVSKGLRGGDGPDARQVLAVDPFHDDVLLTGGDSLVRTETASAPAGGEWVKVASMPKRSARTQVLEFDPHREGVVYRGHSGGIERSTDGGRTWASIGTRPNEEGGSA